MCSSSRKVGGFELCSSATLRKCFIVMEGAIRMVKLFGWEKISKRIDIRRRVELSAIWKLKMYNLLNRTIISKEEEHDELSSESNPRVTSVGQRVSIIFSHVPENDHLTAVEESQVVPVPSM